MDFAVFHPEKKTGSGAAIGNHIDRQEGMEHTYQHADPARRHLNEDTTPDRWKGVPLEKAINDRISEGYKGRKAIRSDAVKFISMVFSGTHEAMESLCFLPSKKEEWVSANRRWAEKEFGAENIMRFTLHMDEKTPHIHCIVVPLTEDGRLSAKELMGNRQNLSARQDRYAEAMQRFGLQRGIKGTNIKHEDAKTYYGRLKTGESKSREAAETAVNAPKIALGSPPAIMGREEWRKEQEKAINGQIEHYRQQVVGHVSHLTMNRHQEEKERWRLEQKMKAIEKEIREAVAKATEPLQKQLNTLQQVNSHNEYLKKQLEYTQQAYKIVLTDVVQIMVDKRITPKQQERYTKQVEAEKQRQEAARQAAAKQAEQQNGRVSALQPEAVKPKSQESGKTDLLQPPKHEQQEEPKKSRDRGMGI